MSIISKNFSVAIFLYVATSLKDEQRASLHLCRNTPYSGATQGTMPSFRFTTFQKRNPDIYVVTNRMSERFFGRRLDLARSKDDGLRGARYCCSFKVPSTYASVAMVRRLAGIARVLRPLSDLFSEVVNQPPRLRFKTGFTTNLASNFTNLPSARGLRTCDTP
jgi:hypothetical protein